MPLIGRPRRTRPRPWLRPPKLRTLAAADRDGRHASWLELFFDLVFVVGIAQLAQQLVEDHTLGGFAIFAALYLPVFIAWQGFMAYADRFDTDDVLFRVVMLAAMLAVAALAVQVPDVAHGDHSAGFAVAYIALRSLLVGLYARVWRHVPAARPLVVRYGGGYAVGVAIWLGSLFVPTPARYVLWGVALAWEYAMPPLALGVHARVPTDYSHMPERFGLFTIIALGESVVAVALGTAHTDWAAASVATAALGFVAVACLWWVYFEVDADVVVPPSPAAILVFAYAHIPLIAALTAVGAGVHVLIEEASHGGHVDAGAAWALAGGAALYLVCVSVAQHETVGRIRLDVKLARLGVAAALVVAAALGTNLSPVILAVIAAALLVGLVTYEVPRALADPASSPGAEPDWPSSARTASSPSRTA